MELIHLRFGFPRGSSARGISCPAPHVFLTWMCQIFMSLWQKHIPGPAPGLGNLLRGAQGCGEGVVRLGIENGICLFS